MFCFLLLGGKAVMETSILQINTGGEALLCLFCCKHESTFMLVECSGLVFLSACVCFHVWMCIELYVCLASLLRVSALFLNLDVSAISLRYVSVNKLSSLGAICSTNVVAVTGGTYSYSNLGCRREMLLQSSAAAKLSNPPNEETGWPWLTSASQSFACHLK